MTRLAIYNLIINLVLFNRRVYVGLSHTAPPTNTKFNPLLLMTQAGIPYIKITSTENHISSIHSLSGSRRWNPFLLTDTTRKLVQFLYHLYNNTNNINNILFSLLQMKFLYNSVSSYKTYINRKLFS